MLMLIIVVVVVVVVVVVTIAIMNSATYMPHICFTGYAMNFTDLPERVLYFSKSDPDQLRISRLCLKNRFWEYFQE